MEGPVLINTGTFGGKEPGCGRLLPGAAGWASSPSPSEKGSVGWGGQLTGSSPCSPINGFTGRGRGRSPRSFGGRGGRHGSFHEGGGGHSHHGNGPRRNGAGGGNAGNGGASVEELVWQIRRLPPGEGVSALASVALPNLDSRACAALLKELARSGLAQRAQEFFDFVLALGPEHEAGARLCDVYTYTAAISNCVGAQQLERALELSANMQRRGIPRNVHTHSALMNVCIKCGQLRAALDAWEDMRRDGCAPNVVTYNTLIDVYGKLGRWEDALQVLARMKRDGIEPVTRTYNTLMIACNTSGQWAAALALHEEMRAAGHALNTTSYNALISAHSKAGELPAVLETYQRMVQQGCERSVITYSSLISACEKSGEWRLALRFFEECLNDGCRPNVITFNSLITACAQGAQWEKAQELFELMHAQHCTPDVVTYTALISACDRGGRWDLALQAFETMHAKGCKPDSIVYNAIIDALWETGLSWPQRAAARLFRRASAAGLLRRGAHSAPDYTELCLHTLTPGVAMLSLYTWLADLRQRALSEGLEGLPARVAVVTGKSRGKDDGAGTIVREAVVAILAACQSPLQDASEGAAATGRLEAGGREVAEWLATSTSLAAALEPWAEAASSAGSGAATEGVPCPPAEARAAAQADEAAAARAAAGFAAVRAFEDGHRLDLQAMGSAYLQERAQVTAELLSMAQALDAPEDIAHDGALLLDRLMSLGGNAAHLTEGRLHLAAAACLHLALAQDPAQAPRALPALSRLADHAGVSLSALGSMKEGVLAALNGDTAAICSLRCLRTYLARLGTPDADAQPVLALATAALHAPDLLNFRPSVVAAALLTVQRLSRGVPPAWPSCLAHLTGLSQCHSPELAAAVTAVRRLCERMLKPAFRAPLRGGVGEEQYRRSPSLGNDDVSSRGSNDAGIVAPSWPSTPRRSHERASPNVGLYGSLSALTGGPNSANTGNTAASSPSGIPSSATSPGLAFGRASSGGGGSLHLPRGSASSAEQALAAAASSWRAFAEPSQATEPDLALYSEALQALQRQQSAALARLQQSALGRSDSHAGSMDAFSPTGAPAQHPFSNNGSMHGAGSMHGGDSMHGGSAHGLPPRGHSFDGSAASEAHFRHLASSLPPRGHSFDAGSVSEAQLRHLSSLLHGPPQQQRQDCCGSPAMRGAFSGNVPGSPAASNFGAAIPQQQQQPSEAELCMLQLAQLQLQSARLQQPASPFAGFAQEAWAQQAHHAPPPPGPASAAAGLSPFQMSPQQQRALAAAAGAYAGAAAAANGSGQGEMHHSASAPAGLFQHELRQLRQLGLLEGIGMQEQGSAQQQWGKPDDKAATMHGMGSAANLLQLLYESQGGNTNSCGYR